MADGMGGGDTSHGQRARGLVEQVDRAAELPPYDGPGVLAVLAEIAAIDDEMELIYQQKEFPDADKARLVVYNTSMARNTRCLLAYYYARQRLIEALRWEHGLALPERLASRMGPLEASFLKDYDRALIAYNLATGVDVTAHVTPPKSHMVLVRATADIGEIMTARGSQRIGRDCTALLPLPDAERLIRRGLAVEQPTDEL